MLFSSLVFLYIFLPIVIIANFLIRKEYRNGLLLISSLIFFAWGGVSFSLILIASVLLNYIIGLLVDKHKANNKSKLYLGIGVIINLAILGIFKYANFAVENINLLFNTYDKELISDPGIILPLGISFYTFQAISYIIDVYREDAKVQRSFFKLALYISFFPQLIAGPIVRYNLIEKQLTHRRNHFTNLTEGIKRFTLGLSKKVLLANQFGLVADQVFNLPINQVSTGTVWIGVISYSFQIYFDFSGYSDMAIGLGRMFGFKLPENFNFPYTAKSVREFWNRWHMTLGQWFRNYLYIPLGGNRGTLLRTIINLLLVFFATSIWHGASWNFVLWGMSHGVFMMLERLGLEKLLKRAGPFIQHAYLLVFIATTWVFFRIEDFSHAFEIVKLMFSFNFNGLHKGIIPNINNIIFISVSIVAILSAAGFWPKLFSFASKGYNNITNNNLKLVFSFTKQLIISGAVLLGILVCTVLLISDTYNPFIYFRF